MGRDGCVLETMIWTTPATVVVEPAIGEVTAAELHSAYVEWAKREGQQEISPTALGRKLSALGYERVKRGGRVFYTGVALVPGNRLN
jgi:hypothetical protein